MRHDPCENKLHLTIRSRCPNFISFIGNCLMTRIWSSHAKRYCYGGNNAMGGSKAAPSTEFHREIYSWLICILKDQAKTLITDYVQISYIGRILSSGLLGCRNDGWLAYHGKRVCRLEDLLMPNHGIQLYIMRHRDQDQGRKQ